MENGSSDQEHYYQTIARLLFNLRGAPFILSPREIDIIEGWEERHIPLRAVLDGMKAAYERFRKNTDSRRRFTLIFCSRFVSTEFSQHRERKVGKKSLSKTRDERVKKVKAEVRSFLKNMPKEALYLKDLYLEILDDLSLDELKDETLESRDEQVDQMLLDRAAQSSMDRYRKEVAVEYDVTGEENRKQVARRKYIKDMRERYKIPYVSLYYY
jgi:hypothetical protein